MKFARVRHAVITPILAASLLGIGAVAALDRTAAVVAAEPDPAASQTVKGEVVMLSSNICVVKDASGTSVMLEVRQQTKLEGSVREGATVEATVAPDGTAILIKAIR